MKLKWYHFWVEFLFGFAIYLWEDIAILLLFIYLVLRLTLIYEYLRKLIRVYQFSNEVKIMAIAKKLDISEDEISKLGDKELAKLTVDQKNSLERDFKDIMR